MKLRIIVFLILTLTVLLQAKAGGYTFECLIILCVYGAQQGGHVDEECVEPLGVYNDTEKVKSSLFGSDKLDCPATKEKRWILLSACLENIYPLDDLVDCAKW